MAETELPFNVGGLPEDAQPLCNENGSVELEKRLEADANRPGAAPDVVIAHAWAFDRNTGILLYFEDSDFESRAEPIMKRLERLTLDRPDLDERAGPLYSRLVWAWKNAASFRDL